MFHETQIELGYPTGERKIYPPADMCIYCGIRSGVRKLTKEHIIPFGLSGTLILPQSSCQECSKITAKVEGIYLQRMIRDARLHLNLASRRKRRNKMPVPPLLIGMRGYPGKNVRWQEISRNKHPYWLYTVGLAPPCALSGADPSVRPLFEFCMLPGQAWQSRWAALGPNVVAEGFFDTTIYVRLLAKIAHSFAAAEIGLKNFQPFLRGIILGDADNAHNFVGGLRPDVDNRASIPDIIHSISLSIVIDLVVVELRLFCFIEGTPNYIVVVGRLSS